eukprot:NODE_926_length_3039_cov_1.403401.p3 type:complete len:171 gc:universal NODE_926_length_3039_cov_1.403401:978-1490(+)
MLFASLSLIFAQDATTPTATTAATTAPSSSTAGSCSQVAEFTSCQSSFQAQKIQTCDRQVQASQAISQASCNLKVMQQTLSCYNFCNIPSSGDERKNYAQQVDQQSKNLQELKAKASPTPTASNSTSSDPTETEDPSTGSNPNGKTSFGNSDASLIEITFTFLLGFLAYL